MMRELSDEQVDRRIKLHTLLALLSAVILVTSMAGQYVISVLLGITLSEPTARGIYFVTQLPFAVIAGVMGILALCYRPRNPLWRSGRIATFVLGVVFIFVFVMPFVTKQLLA